MYGLVVIDDNDGSPFLRIQTQDGQTFRVAIQPIDVPTPVAADQREAAKSPREKTKEISRTWGLDALQQAADDISIQYHLGALTAIVSNHETRRWILSLAPDRNPVSCYGDVQLRAARGLPNDFLIFIYSPFLIGVDPVNHTIETIDREVFCA